MSERVYAKPPINRFSTGKKLFLFIKENIGLLSVLFSVFGIIANAIFRFWIYAYEKGMFDYYEIDIKYMRISYEFSFYQFLISSVVGLVLIFCSIQTCKWFWSEKGVLKKIGKFLGIILALSILDLLIMVLFFTSDIPSFFSNFISFLGLFIALIIFALFQISLIAIINFDIKSIRDFFSEIRTDLKEKPLSKVVMKIASASLCFVLVIYTVILFSVKYNCYNNKDFNIINVDGANYAIITTCDNMYYAYSCKVNQESLVVDTSKYILVDMEGKHIEKHTFKSVKGFRGLLK